MYAGASVCVYICVFERLYVRRIFVHVCLCEDGICVCLYVSKRPDKRGNNFRRKPDQGPHTQKRKKNCVCVLYSNIDNGSDSRLFHKAKDYICGKRERIQEREDIKAGERSYCIIPLSKLYS